MHSAKCSLLWLVIHVKMNRQLTLEQVRKSSWKISSIENDLADENKIYLTVEESILHHVLRLLKKEMPDNVKMLTQYFQFFVNYSSIGRHEVSQIFIFRQDVEMFCLFSVSS